MLQRCVDATLAAGAEEPAGGLPELLSAWPFAHLFGPTLEVAGAELRRRSGDAQRRLSAPAAADARAALLRSLVQVSAPTLAVAFQAFRSAREATLFRVLRRSVDQSSHQLYRAFLAQLRAGGLPELLAAYPVLGRYWGLMVEAWTETLTELLVRLDDDAPLAAQLPGDRVGRGAA